jgi:hypothetical protein
MQQQVRTMAVSSSICDSKHVLDCPDEVPAAIESSELQGNSVFETGQIEKSSQSDPLCFISSPRALDDPRLNVQLTLS